MATKLQEDFIYLKRINQDLINDLSEYATSHNCLDRVLMQGLSFSQSIDLLKRVRDEALTNNNYDSISGASDKGAIEDVSRYINEEIRHHKEVRDVFNAFSANN